MSFEVRAMPNFKQVLLRLNGLWWNSTYHYFCLMKIVICTEIFRINTAETFLLNFLPSQLSSRNDRMQQKETFLEIDLFVSNVNTKCQFFVDKRGKKWC